jgi:antitoxin component of MazEF toxin-antitoxin module
MRAVIKRRGRNACIKIPATLLRAASLDCGSAVGIHAEAGAIVIESAGHRRYSLSELLKRITPESLHGEVW